MRDLQPAKDRGERWAMLTSYDMLTAGVFDEAGVPVLLVGDSAGNNVLGYETTVPVHGRGPAAAGARRRRRGPPRPRRRRPAVRLLPGLPRAGAGDRGPFLRAGAQAVKLEGGRRVLPQVELLVASGVPVMGHLGLTPQSVNTLGGYRVQGRGEAGDRLVEEALALQDAGAFARRARGGARPTSPSGSPRS